MKDLIPQREHFDRPELLGPVWTLRKGGRAAVCTVWSHQFGFELRLVVDGDALPRTQVIRTQSDLIDIQETWRAALEEKGWTKGDSTMAKQTTEPPKPAPDRRPDLIERGGGPKEKKSRKPE